jgi:soluble lytic murein transglycosylase
MFKKRRKPNLLLAIGTGIGVLFFGVGLPVMYQKGFFNSSSNKLALVDSHNEESKVLPLVQLSGQKRTAELENLAQNGQSGDRNRARYLLATDFLEQKQPAKALQWLENLEKDYGLLSGHIALKRAQALELTQDKNKALQAWQDILKYHSKDPVAAEALYILGQKQSEYWDQALKEFPSHPKSIEIAIQRLKKSPNQKDLMIQVAQYGHYHANVIPILDRLVKNYSSDLTSEEWEMIAFAYWEKQQYGKAGAAYANAPRTPHHAYRAGRGLQLGDKTDLARIEYKKLLKEFPDAPESGMGLLRLEKLVDPKESMGYLDQIIAKFPDKAAEAVLDKSKLQEQLKNGKAAAEMREVLLTQYSNSDAAAELRWTLAKQRVKAKDLKSAWEYAQAITKENPNSELAPEAAFWVGKWAKTLGRQNESKQAFEYLLAKYPETYFAWRAAVILGWNVGDFSTIRQKLPEVAYPQFRPTLPAGSDLLKELYNLGQDQDAWTLWQIEYTNPKEPTVAQQFTDGLMRLGVGDNLDAMYMIASLKNREKPEEKSQYQTLKASSAFWQSLYPFPYLDIILPWSKKRELNPLLVTGLIRQESRFMPKIKSGVGAVGLMQVMPETGADMARNLGLKQYKLDSPEDNVQLGTAYLDYTHREYNNNSLLAVASYNAGPANVSEWVTKYGLSDPDNFVDQIPFGETKNYVQKVFENYWNYLRVYNPQLGQKLQAHTDSFKTASNQ